LIPGVLVEGALWVRGPFFFKNRIIKSEKKRHYSPEEE
jgi:hypothetical protein